MSRLPSPPTPPALIALLCVLGAGATPARVDAAEATRPDGPTPTLTEALVRGVAAALRANQRLAAALLWTDELPPGAGRSTAGPALASLRASASGRRQRRIRVRLLRQSYRIVSIRLDRSATVAIAVVEWNQELLPAHLDGIPIGRPVALREEARVELHRIGASRRFVVWHLTLQT